MALSGFATNERGRGQRPEPRQAEWQTKAGELQFTELSPDDDGGWLRRTAVIPFGVKSVLGLHRSQHGYQQRLKGAFRSALAPWIPGKPGIACPADFVNPTEVLIMPALFEEYGVLSLTFSRTIALNEVMDRCAVWARTEEAAQGKLPLVLFEQGKLVTLRQFPGERNYAPQLTLLGWVAVEQAGLGARISPPLSELVANEARPRLPDKTATHALPIPPVPPRPANAAVMADKAAEAAAPWNTPEPTPLPPAANADEPAHDPFSIFRRH